MLQAQLDSEMKKKKELEDQFEDCNNRLERAQELWTPRARLAGALSGGSSA